MQLLTHKTVHVVRTQMSANKGFKTHEEHAVATMFKELKQLDRGAMKGKPAVNTQDPDVLTDDDKKKALEAVHLIKEKRDGNIKSRTCANGKKQRRFVREG